MVYDDYKIHAEFESTGIKKAYQAVAYLQRMVQGKIVLSMNLTRIFMMFI